MNPIKITLPPGSEISNFLYPEMDIKDLTQDILTARLANDYYVDVGWYPECDPKGRFVIRVFHGYWDHQKLSRPIETRDISAVIYNVEALAERFSRTNALPIPQTGVFRIPIPGTSVPG
jgi:hypothetical protein